MAGLEMSYVPGLSEEQIAQFERAACRPEGTIDLWGRYPGIYDPNMPPGILFEVVAGSHVIRIDRVDDRSLRAFHSSPGTGTRVAHVDLARFAPDEILYFAVAWTPEMMRFSVGDESKRSGLVHAEARPSDKQLWVDGKGDVRQVGGSGLRMRGVRLYAGGDPLLAPPALQLWNETCEAVSVLMDGRPQNDNFAGAVCANAGLSMLVTGYETYCESRWRELESEGVRLDAVRVLERFGSRDQRERLSCGQDIRAVLGEQVSERRCAPTLAASINFQNFESCKRAWSLGYGIRFGTDLDLPNQLLERLQRLLVYRHRIVHVSPLIGLLNHPQVPPEDPEFSGPAFLEAAEKTFERFINALHRRTLELRPTSSSEEESHEVTKDAG